MDAPERRRKAIELGLRRRTGMTPDQRERQTELLSALPDWRAKCQACGAQLTGTLSFIRDHQNNCPSRHG